MYIVELGLVMGVNIYMFFCLRNFFFFIIVLYNVLNFVICGFIRILKNCYK